MRVLSAEDLRWVAGGQPSYSGTSIGQEVEEGGSLWTWDGSGWIETVIVEGDGDGWLENVFDWLGDVAGVDGAFGYDGPDGRTFNWQNWGNSFEDAFHDFGRALGDAYDLTGGAVMDLLFGGPGESMRIEGGLRISAFGGGAGLVAPGIDAQGNAVGTQGYVFFQGDILKVYAPPRPLAGFDHIQPGTMSTGWEVDYHSARYTILVDASNNYFMYNQDTGNIEFHPINWAGYPEIPGYENPSGGN